MPLHRPPRLEALTASRKMVAQTLSCARGGNIGPKIVGARGLVMALHGKTMPFGDNMANGRVKWRRMAPRRGTRHQAGALRPKPGVKLMFGEGHGQCKIDFGFG